MPTKKKEVKMRYRVYGRQIGSGMDRSSPYSYETPETAWAHAYDDGIVPEGIESQEILPWNREVFNFPAPGEDEKWWKEFGNG